jgi:hypothetical protein
MKGMKRFLVCLLVFGALLGIYGIGCADENPDSPPADNARYSMEQFDSLSDQEKRDVYFNHPQQLPDNYESYKYRDIMHPEQEQE